MSKTETQTVRPLAAKLRTRRQPDVLPFGDCVWRSYFATVDETLVRAHGFKRFLDSPNYCNQDLHDQLLNAQLFRESENGPVFVRDAWLQHINSLFSVKDSYGARYLFAATQSRIYQLNETNGNWRLLADNLEERPTGMEHVGSRWRFAFLNDHLIAANSNGHVIYYVLNEDNRGNNLSAFRKISDLSLLKISRARVLIEYKGHILLMNAYSGNRPVPGLMVWSQKNMPLVYDPMNQFSDGAAGSWQIMPGISIAAATEYNGNLVVFADKGILVGDETGDSILPFRFEYSYRSDIGHRCLAFPNTLVNTGDFLLYAGRDDIYVMTATSFGPESVDWIREASGLMYRHINLNECEAHVAGHNPSRHEIWISYCSGNSHVPNETLVLNYKYHTAYYRNEGYTAFVNYQGDSRPSFRDFLSSICACTATEMASLYLKEGRPCHTQNCNDPPLYVYTSKTMTVEDPNAPDEPLETEDWEAAFPSSRSMCFILGDKKPSDFCGDCNEKSIFAGVYSGDNCIKELDDDTFYLEMCSMANRNGRLDQMSIITETPSFSDYTKKGYPSELLFGPFTLNNHRSLVCVQNVVLHIESLDPFNPQDSCVIGVAMGTSSVPVDPNERPCGIKWQPMEYRRMQCVDKIRATEQNERPAVRFNIPVYIVGSYLYLRVIVTDKTHDLSRNPTAGVIGGKSRWFSLELAYQKRQ